MRTFNRYFVHFMGIGAMILLVAVLLLVADGGELLVPIFMIALISVDTCFVVLMTIIFSSMAKPQKIKLKTEDNIVKKIERISREKWGRKIIIQKENTTRFMFGNKYKDWLATPIELIEDTNGYSVFLPSADVVDIKYLCDDLVCCNRVKTRITIA